MITAPSAFDGAPFADLTPHRCLDLLEAVGLQPDGRLLQLNSYENRVVLAMQGAAPAVVAKFYRPGRWSEAQILEEHAFAAELAAEEVPVVAPLSLRAGMPIDGAPVELLGPEATLARVGPLRYAVSPRHGGRAPELEDPETLTQIGRFLGRLHAVGRRQPFRHRRRLDAQALGQQSIDLLLRIEAVGPQQRDRWLAAAAEALAAVRLRFEQLGELRWLRVHGDCHPGNLLWTAAGPHFVDLDDCGTGLAVHDFWMLLGGDPADERRQLACLLEGYESFCDFDHRELRLIEALRTLRMLHHSAWIAQRWSDPAFPMAFPWFGSDAYWEQQITQLREQALKLAHGA